MHWFTSIVVIVAIAIGRQSGVGADAGLRDRIAPIVRAAEVDGGAGILLIRKGATPVVQYAWGSASCTDHRDIGSDQLFDIGSITKVITGAAVLKAVEAGRLSLATTVGEVFPDAPADKRSISVEQLLTHRSGLGDVEGSDETLIKRPFFLEQLFKTPIQPLAAGTARYSNAGFSLLAAMLENRLDTAFELFVDASVIRPAGTTIGYRVPPGDRARLVCGRLREMPWGSTADYFGPDGPSWYLLGNGGMLSSLHDLDEWFSALWANRVLGRDSTAMVREALSRRDATGRVSIVTSGSNTIFSSHYEWWPDDDVVLILLTSDSRWQKEKLLPGIRTALVERLLRPAIH
jgi:CubicO group peptidase (beta-lactamase class C family)